MHKKNQVDDFYFHCNVCDVFVKDCQFYVNSQQNKKRYKAHNNDADELKDHLVSRIATIGNVLIHQEAN